MQPSRDLIRNILTCLTQQLLLVHHSTFDEPQVDHTSIVKNVPTFLRSQKLIFLF